MTRTSTTASTTTAGSLLGVVDRHPLGSAMAGVVASAITITLFAPDLVSGSEHEHLAVPAILVWFWAGAALAHLALLDAPTVRPAVGPTIAIWVAAAVLAIFGPQLVTGSDPTHVPLTALAAPVFAAFGTTFACLHAAVRRRGRRQR